jgi:MYXO-CTERM domain-containing protein
MPPARRAFGLAALTIAALLAAPAANPAARFTPRVPDRRAEHGTQRLTGEVPPNLGSFPLVGPMPADAPVTLALGLPLRHHADLARLVEQVSDPTSPRYRHYITPAVFAETYGPRQEDYDALRRFATEHGLKVAGTYTSRSLLIVSGSAAAVERAFYVTLNVYRRPDRSTFYAAANEPSLDLPSPLLLHVSGLDNMAVPIPAGATSGRQCYGLKGFWGPDFRNTYLNPCATAGPIQNMGKGQTIGLFEPDTFDATDIFNYVDGAAGALCPTGETTCQMIQNGGTLLENAVSSIAGQVMVPGGMFRGFYDKPFTPGNGKVEVEVGLEMVLSMAQEANVAIVEQNAATAFLPVAILQQLAEPVPSPLPNKVPDVIANTWTWNAPSPDPLVPPIFEQYAVQGQSFFQASGDLGAYNVAGSKQPNVPDPIIDSPLMTVVGGTEFTAANAETTWNDVRNQSMPLGTCTVGAGQTVGAALQPAGSCNSVSGGGFCKAYGSYPALALPKYQAGITNADIPAGNTTRLIPDVSIVADGLATYTDGAVTCSVGTSASAALWAGVAALANASSTNTKGAVGFANPQLYALGPSALSDIADQSNNSYPGTTGYTATAGYDLATGLGTPTCSLLSSLGTGGMCPPSYCPPDAGTPVDASSLPDANAGDGASEGGSVGGGDAASDATSASDAGGEAGTEGGSTATDSGAGMGDATAPPDATAPLDGSSYDAAGVDAAGPSPSDAAGASEEGGGSAPAAASSSSGCGCRLAAASAPPAAAWTLALLALGLFFRRRRA